MLSVTHQHYFSNLKNGENYNLKPERYYVPSNRLIKGDADAVGNANKNILKLFFTKKAFYFNLTTTELS